MMPGYFSIMCCLSAVKAWLHDCWICSTIDEKYNILINLLGFVLVHTRNAKIVAIFLSAHRDRASVLQCQSKRTGVGLSLYLTDQSDASDREMWVYYPYLAYAWLPMRASEMKSSCLVNVFWWPTLFSFSWECELFYKLSVVSIVSGGKAHHWKMFSQFIIHV